MATAGNVGNVSNFINSLTAVFRFGVEGD